MMHSDRREQWKFDGREIIDGVPHLTWKCKAVTVEGKARHRADVPEWRWGCAVDDFKEVTVGAEAAGTHER